MSRRIAAVLVAASIAAATSVLAASRPACDEACLKGFMDTYLDALAKHQPSLVPVAAQYRYTENGAQLKLGEALWVTFNSFGKYRHDVYDVETGGVVTYANHMENREFPFPGLLSVRLKVVKNKITEIETTVARNQRYAFTNLPPSQEWQDLMNRDEPDATRVSRQTLIKGALGYMRSVAFNDGELAPYAESCIRLENGNITAIGPNDKSPVPMGSGPPGAVADPIGTPAPTPAAGAAEAAPTVERPQLMGIGCGAQLKYRLYSFITGFGDARFPVVDVKRQIVFAVFNFKRRGNVESWTYKGNSFAMGQNMRYPNEVLNTAMFKFVDGKISRVETVIGGLQAYGRGSGWPGGMPEESRPVGE